MPTSRQGEARAIASRPRSPVPPPADTKRVLTAFGRAGWKTSVRGNLVLAEVQP